MTRWYKVEILKTSLPTWSLSKFQALLHIIDKWPYGGHGKVKCTVNASEILQSVADFLTYIEHINGLGNILKKQLIADVLDNENIQIWHKRVQ